jgi:hypothetical protein
VGGLRRGIYSKSEVKSMIACFDSGVINEKDFVIIPNDGKTWEKYRPLDCGDIIYYGPLYLPEHRRS